MKRKLPKLHLRDLFWLVLFVSCLCGWWCEERRLSREVKTWKERVEWWPAGPGQRLEIVIDEDGVETMTIEQRELPIPSVIELPTDGVEIIEPVQKRTRD